MFFQLSVHSAVLNLLLPTVLGASTAVFSDLTYMQP